MRWKGKGCALLLAAVWLTTSAATIDVAVISIVPKEGLSWTFLHWLGAMVAKTEGLVGSVTDVLTTEVTALSDLATLAESRRYGLIVVVGWQLRPAVEAVAAEFPDQNFMMTDVKLTAPLPNVFNVLYQQEQPSAVVGALAAALAVHYGMPHVGLVLGREGAVLHEFEMGYKFGVDWALNKIGRDYPDLLAAAPIAQKPRQERVLWTYTGSFVDPALGRAATEAQVLAGAGVVYNVAGATGLGIFSYVDDHHRERGIPAGLPPFAIGVDLVQEWMSPHIIISALKRADLAVRQAIELIVKGEFRDYVAAHPFVWYNFANGGMGVTDLATFELFLDYMLYLGKISTDDRANLIAHWHYMRNAQPEWVWNVMQEMIDAIMREEVEIPRPFGEPEKWRIEELRKIYG
ncbi:BMP family ABC transporter substrate-binding protein [uncultured Thermanaerothrix sp.]|uniref:BMP family lipoprotein n=1 Tax=uncultured Thermanaerothrix sp. TaxID=1195149 RepID=UPI00261C6759|nr:BMP family ABC transporter substrate-binding protein [uncultured Thermanaerothrix sp.]